MTDRTQSDPHNATISRLDQIQSSLAPCAGDIEHIHRLATLGTLTAGIAHEINNILTPALAYAELAQSHPEDSELVNKALSKAASGIATATRIAESILGFSAAGTDDSSGDEEASLSSITSRALECLASKPEKCGIAIDFDIAPNLMPHMHPIALQHVLLNLILNACDALSGKGGSLRIASKRTSDGNMAITVADTGPGIDPVIADRLFEPFFTTNARGKPSMAGAESPRGGSGLGLAICKHLVNQAGGTIDFQSAPDEGTTFIISLPLRHPPIAKAV